MCSTMEKVGGVGGRSQGGVGGAPGAALCVVGGVRMRASWSGWRAGLELLMSGVSRATGLVGGALWAGPG